MLVWPSGWPTQSSIRSTKLFFHLTYHIPPPLRLNFINAFHVQTWNQKSASWNLYQKNIFLSIFLSRSSFFVNSFGLFKNPIIKPANKEANPPKPKSPSKRPGESHQIATDDRTCLGSHPTKKSYSESRVVFCEVALWRFLKIMAWIVTRRIQDKNLNFLGKDIGLVPQKSNS